MKAGKENCGGAAVGTMALAWQDIRMPSPRVSGPIVFFLFFPFDEFFLPPSDGPPADWDEEGFMVDRSARYDDVRRRLAMMDDNGNEEKRQRSNEDDGGGGQCSPHQ